MITFDLNNQRLVATGTDPERGVVARYFKPDRGNVYGIKVFHRRSVAHARWRAESHAAAAGLAPMVLSLVRQVVRGLPRRHIGYGCMVQHAEPILRSSSNQSLLPDVARIKRLAREAGITPPTDIRRENLGIASGRVVLIDWGRDDTNRAVGRRR